MKITLFSVMELVIFLIALACTGNAFGPRNITSFEESNEVRIPCESTAVQATPFWKINDIIYYFSDVLHPFLSSPSGRGITIPLVDSSMNGTSFQCFIPTSSGDGLVNSSVGILTVLKHENIQIPTSQNSQRQLSLDHQRLLFTLDYFSFAWRISTLENETKGYYQLTTGKSCVPNSNNQVLVNLTEGNHIVLPSGALVDIDEDNTSLYLSLTFIAHDIRLEPFRLSTGIMTRDVHACITNEATLFCIKTPPLNGMQTLVLAIPFLSLSNVTEQDILCPVHPHSSEKCVDLLSCSRFNKTVYANSITICKTVDFESSLELEMCFHNVTDVMNGTKLHFFYSDLQCSSGGRFQSSRTYASSIQLTTTLVDGNVFSVTISNDTNVCLESSLSCFQDLKKTLFKLMIKYDSNICVAYQSYSTINSSCISIDSLTIDEECAESYRLEVEVFNRTVYTQALLEITGHKNILTGSSSKCPCHNVTHPTTKSSVQYVAISICVAIFFSIIVLFVAIIAVSIFNFKYFKN